MGRSSLRKRAPLLAATALGWACAGQGAVTASWIATDGSWSQAANWSTNPAFPNNAGPTTYIARIDTPAASVNLNTSITVDEFQLTAGALTGGGTLTLLAGGSWRGQSTIDGTGTVNLSTGTFTIDDGGSGGDHFFAGFTFNATAPATTAWNSGAIFSTGTEGGTFNNAGVFLDRTDAIWTWTVTQTPVFNNSGLYRRTAGAAGSNHSIDATFNNTGTVSVDTGDLWLAGGGLSTGTFLAAAGTRLMFGDFAQLLSAAGSPQTNLTASSIISSSGEVGFLNSFGDTVTNLSGRIDSAVVRLDPGALGEVNFEPGAVLWANSTPDAFVNSGRIQFDSLQTGGVVFDDVEFAGGRVQGADDLTALGDFTWTGGRIEGTGTQIVEVFGNLTLSGPATKSLIQRAFYSVSTASSTGGDVSLDSADVINSAGAAWQVADDMDFVDAGGSFFSRFFNDGSFAKTAGTGVTQFSDVEMNNTGVVDVQTGILALNGGGQSSGTFTVSSIGELQLGGTGQHFLSSSSTISGPVAARLSLTDSASSQLGGRVNIGVLEMRQNSTATATGSISTSVTVLAPSAGEAVSLDLAGGSLSAGAFLQVGANGFGQLVVRDGASVNATIVDLGVFSASAEGAVAVQSPGSALSSASILRVANLGRASLAVGNGGQVNITQQILIAQEPGSSGSITVNGTGSRIDTGGFISVGERGSGQMDIQTGGRVVSAGLGVAGSLPGSTGSVTVEGVNAVWIGDNQLFIGADGTGALGVFGGASVSAKKAASATNSAIVVGRRGAGAGTITVDGAGSTLEAVDGHLVVGFGSLTTADTLGGRGSLFVRNGGVVSSMNGYLARFPGSIGSVSIQAGGRWNVGGAMAVGGDDLAPGGTAQLVVNGGTLIVPGPMRVWNNAVVSYDAGTLATGPMTLTGGGRVLMQGGLVNAAKTLRVTALSIDSPAGSRIDLSDDRMIVDYGGGVLTTPIADIRGFLQTGYNGGNWAGNGITSTSAAAASGTGSKTGIGYVEAIDIFPAFPGSFGGYAVDNTSVLLRYTLMGDGDLNGTVNIDDFGRLASNFNTAGLWFKGDFNYDGSINIDDFGLLAANFNKVLASPGLQPRGSVPEPGLPGLAMLSGLSLLRRRGNRAAWGIRRNGVT